MKKRLLSLFLAAVLLLALAACNGDTNKTPDNSSDQPGNSGSQDTQGSAKPGAGAKRWASS